MEQNTFTRLTPHELVKTFPEALPIVRQNIKRWKDYKKTIAPLYEELLDAAIEIIIASNLDSEKKEAMAKQWRDMIYDDEGSRYLGNSIPWGLTGQLKLKAIDGHIKRLETLERIFLNKNADPTGQIGDEEISRAKAVPIKNYLTVNRSGFAKCIFHNERTPSMRIYDDHAYCYSCDKKWDTVDVVMKINSIEFIPAVKLILGMK